MKVCSIFRDFSTENQTNFTSIGLFFANLADPDILARANLLRSIGLHAPALPPLLRMLRLFENLADLRTLETITLTVIERSRHAADWKEVDDLLGRTGLFPSLKTVDIRPGVQDILAEAHPDIWLRGWLPILCSRGVLHIHGWT
jgi:hypothetical protein